jgi:outer membrane protein
MKKTLVAVMVAAAFAPAVAMAEAGDWVVRVRAVDISPNEDSELGKKVNKDVGAPVMSPGAELKVDNKVIPELDISYYFTKNIAAELILATGARHDVKVSGDHAGVIGNQDLGSVNLLPPTLTAQWHFMPDQTFDPYVGAGINYTIFMDRDLRFQSGALAGQKIKVDYSSWGPALQAGFDVNLKDGWLLNADVKYVWLSTDVYAQGVPGASAGKNWTKIDNLDINPWVIGVGFGKKF